MEQSENIRVTSVKVDIIISVW